MNKIRLILSNFIRKHKDKIRDVGIKLGMVAMGVLIATVLLSSLSSVKNPIGDEQEKYNVYKPTDTIVKGGDISKEQYEKDSNLVNKFLEYCNNGKIEEAYSLITDECKEEKYRTIEEFKEYYFNYIFEKDRQCNLQSWISSGQYRVYKVRYTNNMLVTGTYDQYDVYEDYITLKKENGIEKISIGSFIDSEKCNIITKTNEIEATVVKKKIYIEDEEYDIHIKNITDKTIVLDNLELNSTILLIANEGNLYNPYKNRLFINRLTIVPGDTTRLTIRFMKGLSSSKKSNRIQFSKTILDYDSYLQNKDEYKDFKSINIKVGD